jgi:thioredoxin 1
MSSTRYSETAPTRDEVDAMRGPVVLDFGAEWCGHCRAARPLVDAALAARPGVRHLRIEDGPGRRLGRSFGVKLWPTLVFMRDGQELERVARPREADALERALASMAQAD